MACDFGLVGVTKEQFEERRRMNHRGSAIFRRGFALLLVGVLLLGGGLVGVGYTVSAAFSPLQLIFIAVAVVGFLVIFAGMAVLSRSYGRRYRNFDFYTALKCPHCGQEALIGDYGRRTITIDYRE